MFLHCLSEHLSLENLVFYFLALSIFTVYFLPLVFLCGSFDFLKKQTKSFPWYAHALQKDCVASPVKRQSLFSHLFTLSCPCHFGLLNALESGTVISEPWHQRLGVLCSPFGTLPLPCGQGQASLQGHERLFGGQPSCHSQGFPKSVYS